jgi:hypothetical protein
LVLIVIVRLNRFSIFATILVLAMASGAFASQPSKSAKTASAHPSSAPASPAVEADKTTPPAQSSDAATEAKCDDGPCDHPKPHIAVTNAPAPAPTARVVTWQDNVAWGANILLAVLGYVGIMMGFSLLKKIDRQTEYAETAAQAATEAANAASMQAQMMINAERPWLLIRVEPAPQMANSFRIMATNRGRGPAEIISSSERIGLAADETQLPDKPEFAKKQSSELPAQTILLPGESMILLSFGRDDMKWVCKTDEGLRRVEQRKDIIFIYGKVVYRDLLAPDEKHIHDTDWCCRYNHGETASSLIVAGPQKYIRHT